MQTTQLLALQTKMTTLSSLQMMMMMRSPRHLPQRRMEWTMTLQMTISSNSMAGFCRIRGNNAEPTFAAAESTVVIKAAVYVRLTATSA